MKAVRISRARRVDSQRSTQTSIMRVKKMLERAKMARRIVDQKASDGWAMPMPMAAETRERVPMTVEALSRPKKMRAVR